MTLKEIEERVSAYYNLSPWQFYSRYVEPELAAGYFQDGNFIHSKIITVLNEIERYLGIKNDKRKI